MLMASRCQQFFQESLSTGRDRGGLTGKQFLAKTSESCPIVHIDGAHADAAKAGMAIGGTIGTGVIMVFWVMGAFILGLLVLFTRGRKTVIEERID